jgi:hypothetical protein
MDAWLDVVLPSESGTFKMPGWIPLSVIQLLRPEIRRLENCHKQWDLKSQKYFI